MLLKVKTPEYVPVTLCCISVEVNWAGGNISFSGLAKAGVCPCHKNDGKSVPCGDVANMLTAGADP